MRVVKWEGDMAVRLPVAGFPFPVSGYELRKLADTRLKKGLISSGGLRTKKIFKKSV
jgi:hypothetical protein